jgi:hypothetical protein
MEVVKQMLSHVRLVEDEDLRWLSKPLIPLQNLREHLILRP